MLVLNGGELWIEFCQPCGENNVLRNPETGQILLVRELFEANYPRTKADYDKATAIAAREDSEMARMQDEADAEWAEWKAYEEAIEADTIERKQLAQDHWEMHEYRCFHSRKHTCPRYIGAAA